MTAAGRAVDIAEWAGIRLIPPDERNPWYGVLMQHNLLVRVKLQSEIDETDRYTHWGWEASKGYLYIILLCPVDKFLTIFQVFNTNRTWPRSSLIFSPKSDTEMVIRVLFSRELGSLRAAFKSCMACRHMSSPRIPSTSLMPISLPLNSMPSPAKLGAPRAVTV